MSLAVSDAVESCCRASGVDFGVMTLKRFQVLQFAAWRSSGLLKPSESIAVLASGGLAVLASGGLAVVASGGLEL